MPRKHWETAKDWFGKRGMALLGALLLWKDSNGKLQSHYVDMVLDNDGEQDGKPFTFSIFP